MPPSTLDLLRRITTTLTQHSTNPSEELLRVALLDAKQVTTLSPSLPAAWLALFSAQIAAGNTQLAVNALDLGLQNCPHDYALWYTRKAAEEIMDGGAKAILLAAEASLNAGAYQDAIAKYTRIVELGRGCEEYGHALRGRSDAWLRKARQAEDDSECFERAAADAQKLVQVYPKWEAGWLWLGIAHLENGSPARARSVFRKGLRLCKESMELLKWLRDAEMVIETEGPESDWEEDSAENEEGKHAAEGKSVVEGKSEGRLQLSGRSEGRIQMDRERGWGGRRALSYMGERNAERIWSERGGLGRRGAGFVRKVSGLGMARERFQERFHAGEWERRKGESSRPYGNGEAAGEEEEVKREEQSRINMEEEREKNLYEMLEVTRDAPQASIKGAYYKLARRYHPDKNQNDEGAKVKFQKLAEAYRVLSDPESRALYDKYGDKGLMQGREPVVEPSTLFAMVFGSDKFVHLIGQLRLATVASHVDEAGNTSNPEVLDKVQRERVGKLVLEMLKTLKPWVDGDKKGFVKTVHKEMKRLQKASFGPSLLTTVGNCYVQHTTYLLDRTRPLKQLSVMMRKATQKSHRIASQQRAMNAAGKVVDKQRRLHGEIMRESTSMSFEDALAREQEMAKRAIDMMWKISVVDIENTLEEVLEIVLSGRDLAVEHVEDDEGSRGWLRVQRGRDSGKLGFAKPLNAMQHGQRAQTRQEILSERAYGILAMGRVFKSAIR